MYWKSLVRKKSKSTVIAFHIQSNKAYEYSWYFRIAKSMISVAAFPWSSPSWVQVVAGAERSQGQDRHPADGRSKQTGWPLQSLLHPARCKLCSTLR
eukprot:g72638.t1